MDPLSDVLRAVRLSGAYFFKAEAVAPWGAINKDGQEVRERLLPGVEHVMSYHILVEGRAWASLEGQAPFALLPGDVVVFPHGDGHFLSSDPAGRPDPARHLVRLARYPETVRVGVGAPDAVFVCGFLACDRWPFNPLLASLPRVLHVQGLRSGWLSLFVSQVLEESASASAGAATVLARSAELMFIEVLRQHAGSLGPGQGGWLAGIADGVVGRAIAELHADPRRDWTLESLAAAVATSRSVLAERFTRMVGQPPMQYLAAWRMQLAAGMLAAGTHKIASVAAGVGYESEAAFSRAFKRATGHAPGAWRSRPKAAHAPLAAADSLTEVRQRVALT